MGTLIGGTVAPAQMGVGQETEKMLLEKYAWQMDRGVQGNKTASVVRSTESGGVSYAHVEPSYTQVEGLTDLPVLVDDYSRAYVDRHGAQSTDAERMFVFYDVTGDVMNDDVIQYDGDEYEVVNVWKEAESGRCEVRAKLARLGY